MTTSTKLIAEGSNGLEESASVGGAETPPAVGASGGVGSRITTGAADASPGGVVSAFGILLAFHIAEAALGLSTASISPGRSTKKIWKTLGWILQDESAGGFAYRIIFSEVKSSQGLLFSEAKGPHAEAHGPFLCPNDPRE